MRSVNFARCAPNVFAAAAILAGCGGSQPPIGAPGEMRQVATHHALRRVPGSHVGYMYVTDVVGVQVLTYPQEKAIGTIPQYGPMCTDENSGNVYISNGSDIEEFSPGGLAPIASLNFGESKDLFSYGCSVDPTTGNLAVMMTGGNGGSTTWFVSVYRSLGGKPINYGEANLTGQAEFCGYDNKGNLFIDGAATSGSGLAELPKGGSAFEAISVDGTVGNGPVQFDGTYITVQPKEQPATIYRIAISGSTGTIAGTTVLDRRAGKHIKLFDHTWILGGTVFSGQGGRNNTNVGLYKYPAGGQPYKKIDPDPKAKKGNTYVNYIIVTFSPS